MTFKNVRLSGQQDGIHIYGVSRSEIRSLNDMDVWTTEQSYVIHHII